MATFLNPPLVYGPVHSRRLGASLGVNLSPADGKICSFDCIYCENGFDADRRTKSHHPRANELAAALENKLQDMATAGEPLDVITLAGNGEPTGNPEFPQVVDAAIALRDKLYPKAKVAVLSNATFAGRPAVHDALMRVDDNIEKLDTVDPDYIRLIDRPVGAYDVDHVIESLCAFEGHVIVQTIFLRGTFTDADGVIHNMDNTGERYLGPWLDALKRIKPSGVTVYTIARDTPAPDLAKVGRAQMDAIADRVRALGITCSASY